MTLRVDISLLTVSLLFLGFSVQAREKLVLQQDDVISFLGGTSMVNVQTAGYLETLVTRGHPNLNLRFRDFSWEGDTVFAQGTVLERWRQQAFGDLSAQLKVAGTTVLVLQFGKMESLQGRKGLEGFLGHYKNLLEELSLVTERVVIVSPTPFEKMPDGIDRNRDLAIYTEEIRALAAKRSCLYVDLQALPAEVTPLTKNGIHVRPDRQERLAHHIVHQLGMDGSPAGELESLRQAVLYKHRFWTEYQRPANWKCLFGDDGTRVFSVGRGGRNPVTLKSEWEQYPELVAFAEARIQAMAQGREAAPAKVTVEGLTGSNEADIEKELASFELDERFQIQAFATEELGIPCPLQMSWDGKGRLYVISTTAYPQIQPGQVPDDKIIILEDLDHDGTADRSTVFAEGLNIPTGIEFGPGGVYVAHGTELLFFKDTDGDDRVDVKTVLYSGFGIGDTHQTSNSLVWSPGGRLFFGQGDGIESRVETAHGVRSLFRAGFFRYDPHRQRLDPLLNDASGPGNPWGIVFDDWGQSFSSDGAGGIDYLTPGSIPTERGRRLPKLEKGGGYCGLEIISSAQFPEDMQGDFLVGDYKANSVRRFSTKAKGSGFVLEWKGDLLQSRHRNFRPVDIRMGPDGAIYIADWYNPVICHQEDYFRDSGRDKTHGRIWRISVKNGIASRRVELSTLSHRDLVRQLASPEKWYRYQVRREMTRRDAGELDRVLDQWVDALNPSDPSHEHHLYEALAAHATIDRVDEKLLRQLLRTRDFRARAFAVGWIGHWQDRLRDPLSLLELAVGDEHPLVRMKAVIACAHIPAARSIEVAARVTDKPMDEGIRYAFAQATYHLEEHWIDSMSDLCKGNSRHRAAVLSQLRSKKVLGGLVALASDRDLDAESRLAVLRGIVNIGGGKELRLVLEPETYGDGERYQVDLHAVMLADLARLFQTRGRRPGGNLATVLGGLMVRQPEALRIAAIKLAGLWRVDPLQKQVLAIARNTSQPEVVRFVAIQALYGQSRETKAFLCGVVKRGPQEMKLAAITALAAVDLALAAEEAGEILLSQAAADAPALIRIFLSRAGGTDALAGVLGLASLSAETAATYLQIVQASGRSDEALTAVLKKASGLRGELLAHDGVYVTALAKEAVRHGDAVKGRKIFLSTGCGACHQVDRTPAVIGPNLRAVGARMSVELIVEKIMWPARNVKEGYSLMTVITKDGLIHQGYERTSKDQGDDLMMREMAAYKIKRIPRNQIESVEDSGSAMPPGIVEHLKREDIGDLVKYLTTLGAK